MNNQSDDLLAALLMQINKIDFHELSGIESGKRISEKYKCVTVIDELLRIASENDLDLCVLKNAVHIYSSAYWLMIKNHDFDNFLGNVGLKMGIEKTDATYHKFIHDLKKQFFLSVPTPDVRIDGRISLLNLQNGTFEFNPGERLLREFRKEDYLTYQLGYEYNPEATCPMFEEFLNKVLPDKECQLILSEYAGYTFTRNLRLEACLFLVGVGANGKSVVFHIVNNLLGTEHITNFSLSELKEDYNRTELEGKLLNYSSELGKDLDLNIFKQIVSMERISTKPMYRKPGWLKYIPKLMANCNMLPIAEVTPAFFRRCMLLPFKVVIPREERDPELAFKIIKKELPGVFNWFIKGYDRIIKNKAFTKSDLSDEFLDNYAYDSDNVRQFIEDEGYKRSATAYILRPALYSRYQSHCFLTRTIAERPGIFRQRLESLGIVIERHKDGNRVYLDPPLGN